MNKKSDIQKNGSRPDYFINSRGIRVEFLPVNQNSIDDLIEAIRQKYANESLDPPTYEIEVFGGGKKVEPHNATTPKTEEEQTAWETHQVALRRFTTEWTEAVLKLLILDGVKNDVPEEWIKRRKFIGAPLPDDPLELKWIYARSELIVSNEDNNELQVMPRLLSYQGLTDEEYAQQEQRFRYILEAVKGRAGATTEEPVAEQ